MNINTKEYWEDRFKSGSWEQNSGFNQSAYFGNLIFDSISEKVKNDMRNSTLLDYGCACGQVANIFNQIDNIKITGFDLSSEAVNIATHLFSDIEFTDKLPNDSFDIILFSHILEHIDDGMQLVKDNLNRCNKYIIISTPYKEDAFNLIQEHVVSVDDEYFEQTIGEFVMIEKYIIDTRDSGFWHGDVIIVVYEKQ